MAPWWLLALMFVVGAMLGAAIGVVCMAMLQINRDKEEWPFDED